MFLSCTRHGKHLYNPRTWEVCTGGLQIHPRLHIANLGHIQPILKEKRKNTICRIKYLEETLRCLTHPKKKLRANMTLLYHNIKIQHFRQTHCASHAQSVIAYTKL